VFSKSSKKAVSTSVRASSTAIVIQPITPTKKSSTAIVVVPTTPPIRTVVHTSAIPADPRCPYPYPGIYCGKPKTTLITVTETRK
jgi:hypothetical protein